jgi:hypothetical protein
MRSTQICNFAKQRKKEKKKNLRAHADSLKEEREIVFFKKCKRIESSYNKIEIEIDCSDINCAILLLGGAADLPYRVLALYGSFGFPFRLKKVDNLINLK